MCLNRILVSDSEVYPADEHGTRDVVLPPDDERTRHVRNVLKVEEGNTIRIAVEHLGTCEATVTTERNDEECITDRKSPAPLALRLDSIQAPLSLPPITLVMAPPRPRALRRAIRAAAQVGLSRIVLVGAARVERSYFASKALRPESLRANAVDGVMQAAVDAHVPPVETQPRLHLLPETLGEVNGTRIVLHPGGPPLENVLEEAAPERVVLAIGPEGGWLDNELQFLQRNGFVLAALGPRILSTEVALTVALTLTHQKLALTSHQHSTAFVAT